MYASSESDDDEAVLSLLKKTCISPPLGTIQLQGTVVTVIDDTTATTPNS
jgi:hypothetical protein